jgi:hypothetical protein
MTAHATIDISIAPRADPPRVDENALTCAACGKLGQFAGAAIVKVVPLSAEARAGMKPHEDMLPLCADCLGSPHDVGTTIVRSYYPDIHITEGGQIKTQ